MAITGARHRMPNGKMMAGAKHPTKKVKGKIGVGSGVKGKATVPKATVIKTLTKADAPKNVKQKNIVKVERLKNKSTLTTLKGNRKIQQVAGKSAYVVARGAGKPSIQKKKSSKKKK